MCETMAELEKTTDITKNPAWEAVKQYMEEGTVLKLEVGGVVNKGVIVYVEGLRGFIPVSHLDVKFVEDPNAFLNQEVEAKVITVDEAKNRLVLSVKEVILAKREAEKQAKINAIEVGSIVEGTVESLQKYGAFISLGDGISGLCHISQIAKKRIEDPAEVLKKGQEVKAKVVKVADGKIGLSIKAAEEAAPAPKREKAAPAPTYKDEGSASTSLGALLAGLKLD